MARERKQERRSLDQAILTAALWFIPMALFGYVGWQFMLATGNDPSAWLPLISVWQILFVVVAIFGAVALALTWNRNRAERSDDAKIDAAATKH